MNMLTTRVEFNALLTGFVYLIGKRSGPVFAGPIFLLIQSALLLPIILNKLLNFTCIDPLDDGLGDTFLSTFERMTICATADIARLTATTNCHQIIF